MQGKRIVTIRERTNSEERVPFERKYFTSITRRSGVRRDEVPVTQTGGI